MRSHEFAWAKFAAELEGPRLAEFQTGLTTYNAQRLRPALPSPDLRRELAQECMVARAEVEFVESLRRVIAPLVADIPEEVDGFVAWFERLRDSGPGQGDPLFPWLANEATLEQMKWFLLQEVAGEAGFDDLLAITQVQMPEQAKLEMARNYWDEMGGGARRACTGRCWRVLPLTSSSSRRPTSWLLNCWRWETR